MMHKFDDFLSADLNNLGKDELASLWHFADKGYFTVERKIVIKLLQDRLSERSVPNASADPIVQRAQYLAEQNELRLRDMRTAAAMFDAVHEKQFHVPEHLNQQEIESLRSLTGQQLQAAKREIAVLDKQLHDLMEQLNESEE
jgi:hypothetical protein